MKTIITLLAVILSSVQINAGVKTDLQTSPVQATKKEIVCSADRILPTDIFTIIVKDACVNLTYFLYEENAAEPLISAKGNGQDLLFTGMWGAGNFKVLDDTGQEMSNRVEKSLYWPLNYNFERSEMDPKYPFSADGAVANLDLYASWGPKLDEEMIEFFDRLNAGDSPNWDPKTMRIHAESLETIDEEGHTVFHIKIFVAPNLIPVKVDNILGIRSYEGIPCYNFYQYPLPEGHLYDWDVNYGTDEIKGNFIRLSNTQYLVEYQLYNYGELVASKLQEPYEEVCFNRLGPGIYTTKVSHQGSSRSHANVLKVQLDKFIQQRPLITYEAGPSIALDKQGGIKYFSCKRDTIVPIDAVRQVIEEFNTTNPNMQMSINDVSSNRYEIELIYEPNFSDELIIDSKFIFHDKSHVRFVQAGSKDLMVYDVLYGMIPEPFIKLSGSQPGILYEICEDGNPTGISMEGTGQPIAFDNVPVGAIFTVRATKTGHSIGGKPVARDMNGKAVLLVNPEGIITPYANAITTQTYVDESRSFADITYYDGLGAPVQTVLNMAAPDGRNLIRPILYDEMYRDNARQLLPFPIDKYTGERVFEPEEPQKQYYSQRKGIWDNSPYTLNYFDNSGLDRIYRSYRPGDIFRADNKFTEFVYETNSKADKVYDFRYNYEDGSIVVSGYIDKGTYSKQTIIDEDGNRIAKFADVNGKIMLERRYIGHNLFADTYYIYDPCYSRLVCVVSPEGSSRLQLNLRLQWDDDLSDRYCYRYLYDGRGNLIERQVPGRAKEFFVYDKSDRLIYSTDANLKARKEWLYYAYDNHGNMLRQSLLVFHYNENRIFLQNYYNRIDNLLPSLNRAESLDFPYDFDSFISSSLSRNLATYIYGNVDYTKTAEGFVETQWTAPEDLAFRSVGFLETRLPNPQGLKTYEKLLVLGTDNQQPGYVERTFHYDYKKRIIQIVERNPEGGISRTSYEYDRLDNILRSKESRQLCAGVAADSVTTLYTYDNRCRLIREEFEFNDHPTVDIEYSYNELGELVGKSTRGGALKSSMEYNLQGWLTNKQVTDNGDPVWDMRLKYYDPHLQATEPSYTGNITEWSWCRNDSTSENTYSFAYDQLVRLKDTKQYIGDVSADRFVEKGLTYDSNGNILTLRRTRLGLSADSLAYSYTGNQLTSLSGTTTGNYTYDANGNMTYDGANDLNISYNQLNLTEKIERNGEILAKYSYLSDGTKLSATDADGNGLYYLGSLVYRKQDGLISLESAAFSGGRFVATAAGIETRYHLTDHLGSVRTIVNGDGETIEHNDFYPFGMRWNDPASQFSDNRYRYNGKEEQTFLNVPYTDYGARLYDPRFRLSWGGVDPLAVRYNQTTPYGYCVNNPVNAIDTDGRLIVFVGGFEFQRSVTTVGALAATTLLDGVQKNSLLLSALGSLPDRNFSSEDTYGWGDVDNLYMNTFNDNNVLYTQGRTTLYSEASQRYAKGIEAGRRLAAKIASGEISLTDDETIKLVGHSQGAAYAAGLAQGLIEAGYGDRIAMVDYIAAHQAGGFSHPLGIPGRQFGSSRDILSGFGWKTINNIESENHHVADFGKWLGHSITSQEINDFLTKCIAAGVPITIQ